MDSAGSAAEEEKKYQQSVQYSIDQTKAKLEELSADLLSSNFLMINSCFSILLGIIFSVLFAILFQVKYIKSFMVKHFHKTFNDDIWQDVFDLKDGCNIKVFLKDKDYYIIGHLKSYEEKGKDSWIALSGFSMYSKKDNTLCKNHPDYSKNSSIIITFRFSDIDYMEIF